MHVARGCPEVVRGRLRSVDKAHTRPGTGSHTIGRGMALESRMSERAGTPIAGSDRRTEPLIPLLALVTLIQALATFAVLSLPTLAPKAALTFGVAPHDVGYQISLVYSAAALLSILAGVIVRRLGAARSSLLALASAATGLTAIASGNMAAMIAGSLVLGIGYGLTNPAASHLLGRFAPPGPHNLVYAIKQSGVPLGGVLAALLLPSLSERVGWQTAVAASTLLFGLLAIPLLMRVSAWDDDRDTSISIGRSGAAGLVTIASDPMLTALAVVGGSYAGYQFCLLAYTITMLVTELGWSLVDAGLAATAVQISGIVGRIGWSLIADRLRRGIGVLIVIGLASSVLGLSISLAAHDWPALAIVGLLVVFGVCIVGWNGVYMAEVAHVAGPARASLATGGVLVFNFLGVIVMPAAFALAARLTGSFLATFGLFAGLPLIGSLVLLRVARRTGS